MGACQGGEIPVRPPCHHPDTDPRSPMPPFGPTRVEGPSISITSREDPKTFLSPAAPGSALSSVPS